MKENIAGKKFLDASLWKDEEFIEFAEHGFAADDPDIVETYKELKKQAVEKARKTLACKKIEFSSIHTPEQIAKLGSSFKILYASLYAVLKKYIETKLIEGNRLSCYDACMHLMQTELSIAELAHEYFIKLLIQNKEKVRLEGLDEIHTNTSISEVFTKHLKYQIDPKEILKSNKFVFKRLVIVYPEFLTNALLIALSLHQLSKAEMFLEKNKVEDALDFIYEATKIYSIEQQISLNMLMGHEARYMRGSGAREKHKKDPKNKYLYSITEDWFALTAEQKKRGYKMKFCELLINKYSHPSGEFDSTRINDPRTVYELVSKVEMMDRHGFNKAMIQYVVCGRPLLKNSM